MVEHKDTLIFLTRIKLFHPPHIYEKYELRKMSEKKRNTYYIQGNKREKTTCDKILFLLKKRKKKSFTYETSFASY